MNTFDFFRSAWANFIVEDLLALAVGSTLFVLLAWGLQRAGRRAGAAYRCSVWQLSGAATVLLATALLVLPGIPLRTTLRRPQTAGSTSVSQVNLVSAALRNERLAQSNVSDPAEGSVETSSPAASRPSPRQTAGQDKSSAGAAQTADPLSGLRLSWRSILMGTWLTIATTYLVLFLWASRAIRRIVRCVPPDTPAEAQGSLNRCRQRLGIPAKRRIRVLYSPLVEVPFAFGIFRETIVLPKSAMLWQESKLDLVLTHEMSHLVRHDIFWHWVVRLACCVAWFNPLIWFALRRAVLEREQACDDVVLRSRFSHVDYAQVLVDLAAECSTKRVLPTAALSMAEQPLRSRLKNILDQGVVRAPISPRVQTLVAAMFFSVALPIGVLRPLESRIARAQEGELVDDSDGQALASVSATITTESGEAIAGAEAEVMKWTGGGYQSVSATATSDAEGKVQLRIPYSDDYFYLKIAAEGLATSVRSLQLSAGDEEHFDFKLSPPARGWIDVTALGQPVAGAEISYLEFVDVNQNKVYLTGDSGGQLGYEMLASGKDGRLLLPALPAGAQASLRVVHPDWKTESCDDLVVSDARLAKVSLQSGVRVSIELLGPAGIHEKIEGEKAEISLFSARNGSRHPTSIRHSFPIRDGRVEFTAYPMEYTELRFKVNRYFTSPMLLNYPDMPNAQFNFRDQKTVKFQLNLHPKAKARGRLVDSQGRGVANAWVTAAIALDQSPSVVAPEDGPSSAIASYARKWAPAGDATTDDQGYYEIELSRGKVQWEVIHEGYFSSPSTSEYEWSGKIEDQLPVKTLLPVPTLKGLVVDTAGKPVIGSIVRMRHRGRGDADPVDESSSDGSFELQMRRIPYSIDGEGLETTVYALAFDPKSNRAGIAEVDLTDPAATENIRVVISSQSADWPLNALGTQSNINPKRQELINEQISARQQATPKGMPGNVAPVMSEGTWLNTDAKSLRDFRGKYVLLDFWFIGCGPCIRDMPSVKLAHQKFFDQGFTVVSVHKDGQLPEDVQAYANEHGMSYPIVVDDASGTITKQYREYGLYAYPTYMLLDPEGKIIHNDALSANGSLRMSKLEMIYQTIREHIE